MKNVVLNGYICALIILVFVFSYLDEVLEPFVVLLKFLEEADGVVVVAAELPVDLLHPLCILLRELWEHT